MSNAPTKPQQQPPSNLPSPAGPTMWGRRVKAVYLFTAVTFLGKGAPVWRLTTSEKDIVTAIINNEMVVKSMETHPGGVEAVLKNDEKILIPHAHYTHLIYA